MLNEEFKKFLEFFVLFKCSRERNVRGIRVLKTIYEMKQRGLVILGISYFSYFFFVNHLSDIELI